MPLAAAYTASKQAIQGFTQSLAHELAAFGIATKLVEPGYAPTTRFAANTDINVMDLLPGAYLDFARPIFAAFTTPPISPVSRVIPADSIATSYTRAVRIFFR